MRQIGIASLYDFILQADDAPSRQRWMEFIQQLNQKHSKHKKLLSPQAGRRMTSPSPQPYKPGTGGLLGRIKKTLKAKHQRGEAEDSSFIVFGQPLKDCPVSPDNKVGINWSNFRYRTGYLLNVCVCVCVCVSARAFGG